MGQTTHSTERILVYYKVSITRIIRYMLLFGIYLINRQNMKAVFNKDLVKVKLCCTYYMHVVLSYLFKAFQMYNQDIW